MREGHGGWGTIFLLLATIKIKPIMGEYVEGGRGGEGNVKVSIGIREKKRGGKEKKEKKEEVESINEMSFVRPTSTHLPTH